MADDISFFVCVHEQLPVLANKVSTVGMSIIYHFPFPSAGTPALRSLFPCVLLAMPKEALSVHQWPGSWPYLRQTLSFGNTARRPPLFLFSSRGSDTACHTAHTGGNFLPNHGRSVHTSCALTLPFPDPSLTVPRSLIEKALWQG